MNPLKLSELGSVLRVTHGPCVSLYVSSGSHGLWSPRTVLRYRKLLKQAENLLKEQCDARTTAQLLKPMGYYSSLQSQVPQAQTLCFFSSPEMNGYFPLSEPSPDLCVVAESFHVTPIADFVNPVRTWFLVKLTKAGMNLYRGRGSALEFLDSFHMAEHPRTSVSTSNPHDGQRYIRFTDEDHLRLDDFLSTYIDDDHSRFPLIMTGTKTDTDGYEKATAHNFDLTINFSERYRELGTQDILSTVWPKVNELFVLEKKMALAGLSHARQSGRTTSDPEQVANRLSAGELRTMAVCHGSPDWGRIDWKTGRISRRPKTADGQTDCIYDDLVERAMVQGCKVLFCSPTELPQGSRLLAV